VSFYVLSFSLLKVFSGLDAGIKMRPDQADLQDLGQDFEKAWENFHAPAPDKPLIIVCPVAK
jgi:alcohol oxidase